MPDVIKVQRRLDELLGKLRITLLDKRIFTLVSNEWLLTNHIPIKNTLD